MCFKYWEESLHCKEINSPRDMTRVLIFIISKIQLVVYYQSCLLIGWATTRLYVIAH